MTAAPSDLGAALLKAIVAELVGLRACRALDRATLAAPAPQPIRGAR